VSVPTLRERVIAFTNDPKVIAHTFYGISAAFIATTIFISLSRGGIISLSCSLLLMATILRSRSLLHSNRYWFILVPSVTLVFVSWFGWKMIVERFLNIQHPEKIFYDSRFDIWLDALTMTREFIFSGAGFGSFEKVFPLFRTQASWQSVIDHAHNDYLELLATGGLISFLLLTWFMATVARKVWPLWRRRKNRYVVFLGGACMVAIVSLLLHGFVDFNFYSGANALYFFMFCGLLVTISHSSDKSGRPPNPLEKRQLSRAAALAGITVSALLLTTSLYFNIGAMKGEYLYRKIHALPLDPTTPQEELLELQALTDKITAWDPLEPKYSYSAGNVALFLDDRGRAAEHYNRALDLDPTDSWSLLQLGQLLATTNNPQGLKMMETAVRFAPFDLEVLNRYSHLLLWLGEEEKALAISGRILTLTEGGENIQEYFSLLRKYAIPVDKIHQVTPKTPTMLLILGNFLAKNKMAAKAEPIYEEAMVLATVTPAPRPWYFTSAYWFFLQQKDLPRAVNAVELGLKFFPEEPELFSSRGEAQRKLNNLVGSEASFRRAVELAPDHPGFRLQLANILTDLDKIEEANLEYEKTRKLLETSSKSRPWHFNSLRYYYQKKKRFDAALTIMKKAVEVFPDNAESFLYLGDIHLQMGDKYQAELSYRQALKLGPDNLAATDRLEMLSKESHN